MIKRYQNMESATLDMGYGKLTNTNDIRYGGGITDNDTRVWLHILCDPNNNWYNMYSNNDNVKKEIIIQIANTEQVKKEFIDYFSNIFLPDEPTHVIFRQNFDDSKKNYEYDNIGNYCTILINMEKYTTFHVKNDSSLTKGKVLFSKDKKLKWLDSFASSESEAYKKFNKLAGDTLRVLREL